MPPSGSTRTRPRQPEAERLAELRELLAHPKVVAVGETGLDTVRRFATPEQQRRLFDAQLALADELGLPVVVHNREADDETAAALAPFTGTRGPPLLLVARPCHDSQSSVATTSRSPAT